MSISTNRKYARDKMKNMINAGFIIKQLQAQIPAQVLFDQITCPLRHMKQNCRVKNKVET